MKLALAQLNLTIGAVSENLKKILATVRKAEAEKVDLLITSELALTGYPPRDLLDDRRLIDHNLEALTTLAAHAKNLPVLCGFVERNPEKQGRPFFNSCALLENGKIGQVFRKRLLPVYDVFDDPRYFEEGNAPIECTIRGKRIAVTICEDAWNSQQGYLSRAYSEDVLSSSQKLDLIVNLSASPFSVGKPETRFQMFSKIAARLKTPFAFCNQVGANDELIFDGNSFVLNSEGMLTAQAPAFAEVLLVSGLGTNTALPNFPSRTASIFEALSIGIRDYAHKTGHEKVCIGISGGVDSSVVAALAVHALGKENVLGIALPTRFNAKASLEDAMTLTQALGMEFRVQSIETLFASAQSVLKPLLNRDPQSLTSENLQPRLRMTILMGIANEEKRLLLNTSNKSEMAAGYATLYGDTAGALSVLGDLTKQQVYDLARHVNRTTRIIPERILTRAPSAELKENQTDQDTLPPYEILDALVVAHIEKGADKSELLKIAPSETVEKFLKLHSISEYKRRQVPPVLRVSTRAFGIGRRMPIARG